MFLVEFFELNSSHTSNEKFWSKIVSLFLYFPYKKDTLLIMIGQIPVFFDYLYISYAEYPSQAVYLKYIVKEEKHFAIFIMTEEVNTIFTVKFTAVMVEEVVKEVVMVVSDKRVGTKSTYIPVFYLCNTVSSLT